MRLSNGQLDWDTGNSFQQEATGVSSFAFSANNQAFYLGTDGRLTSWIVPTGASTLVDTSVRSFYLDPVYGDLVTLHSDGGLFIRGGNGLMVPYLGPGVNYPVAQFAVGTDGQEYVLGTDGRLTSWIVPTGASTLVDTDVQSFYMDPVYGDLVTLHYGGELFIRGGNGLMRPYLGPGVNYPVAQFAVGRDGQEYVLGTDGRLTSWIVPTGASTLVDTDVQSFYLNPVYGDLVTLHYGGGLFIRGGNGFMSPYLGRGVNYPVAQFAVGPDGRECVLGSDGRLWSGNPGGNGGVGTEIDSNVKTFVLGPGGFTVDILQLAGNLWQDSYSGWTLLDQNVQSIWLANGGYTLDALENTGTLRQFKA